MYTAGALLATPLLDISSKTTTDGERGLLSVALHPDFATDGYFFVGYTSTAGGPRRIPRSNPLTASGDLGGQIPDET